MKNNQQGWIKLHRSILEWEWYDEPNTIRLFIHLLLKANHKPKKYRGVLIEYGQVMTGQELLAKEIKLTRSKIRLALDNLKTTNEITINSSPQGTIIQIVNYQNYQITTSEKTTEQPKDNQRTTTNKNDNNEKETYRSFEHLKISNEEFSRLESRWTKKQIDQVLDSIENYKNNTNYKSLSLTAKNWLMKDYPEKKKKLAPVKHWNQS